MSTLGTTAAFRFQQNVLPVQRYMLTQKTRRLREGLGRACILPSTVVLYAAIAEA